MKVLSLFVLMFVLAAAVSAQTWSGGPRVFSYQGVLLEKTGVPLSGTHTFLVELYDGASVGAAFYQESHTDGVTNGTFDLVIGSASPTYGLPESITFDRPCWMGLTVDPGGANEMKFPRQQILSAPYAFNSERVNGIEVSAAPIAGKIFPIPMLNGKVDPNFLPPTPASIQAVNTVGPDNNGSISLKGSNGVVIVDDVLTHTLTISNPAPGTGATMVAVGTTAERPPVGVQGMIRFNTTTSKFEGFDGAAWVNLN